MAVNGSNAFPLARRPDDVPGSCPHDAAREIHMYMPYAEANAVRLRLIRAGDPRWHHVSGIYEIPHGWAWTLCKECPANAGRETGEE